MIASIGLGDFGNLNIVASFDVQLAMRLASIVSGGGVKDRGVEAPEDVDLAEGGIEVDVR